MEIKQGKQVHPLRTVTQEKLDKILNCIKRGAPIKYAAEANGLSKGHFHNLINQGIMDIDNDLTETIHAKLVDSMRNIQMEEIISCEADVRNSDRSHKGAQWILEQKYWREFGANSQIKELADDIDNIKQKTKEIENEG